MKTINYIFFLKNYLIVLIFIFSGCQLSQHSTFKQRPAVYNIVQKVIEQKDKDSLSNKAEKSKKVIDKPVEKSPKKLSAQFNFKKEKKYFLTIDSFLKKTSLDIIPHLGKPNLVIKHGQTLNYQYHLVNCFVDLFFIKKLNKMILHHFELRPIKINSEFNKILCNEEINKIINKK